MPPNKIHKHNGKSGQPVREGIVASCQGYAIIRRNKGKRNSFENGDDSGNKLSLKLGSVLEFICLQPLKGRLCAVHGTIKTSLTNLVPYVALLHLDDSSLTPEVCADVADQTPPSNHSEDFVSSALERNQFYTLFCF